MAYKKADEDKFNKSWGDFCQMREAMGKPLRDSRERKSVLYRLIQYSGGDLRLMAAILDKAVENKRAILLPLHSSPARTVKELVKGVANTISL